MRGRQVLGSSTHQHRHCEVRKTLLTLALLSSSPILDSADLAEDALDWLDDVDVGPDPDSDGLAEHTLGAKNVPLDDDDSEDEAAAGHASVVDGSYLNQCISPGSVKLTW